VARGLLYHTILIIAGYMNFTTNDGEVWGSSTSLSRLAGYFITLLHEHLLVDFPLNDLVPTWHNGHCSLEAISKRLNQVLLSEELTIQYGRIKTWVDNTFLSNHALILLELDSPPTPKEFPFKFNSSRLLESDFNSIVKYFWKDTIFLTKLGVQFFFLGNTRL